jgi:hypothetical protein
MALARGVVDLGGEKQTQAGLIGIKTGISNPWLAFYEPNQPGRPAMQVNSSPADRHSLVGRALDWWHGVRDNWQRMHELDLLSEHEVERMAHDMGVTADQLVAMSRESNGTQLLLERRLASLHLNAEEIRKISPLLLADLQRTCAHCSEKKRCLHDFKVSETHEGWESYCPNAGTLKTLI